MRGEWALVDETDMSSPMPWRQPPQPADYFRFGVRYADGRSAATSTWEAEESTLAMLVDSGEEPEGLVLLPREGSSSNGHASVGIWVWPAPTHDPVDLAVEWPGASIPQTLAAISAEVLEEGRSGVKILW